MGAIKYFCEFAGTSIDFSMSDNCNRIITL